jgi:hypothetical protein
MSPSSEEKKQTRKTRMLANIWYETTRVIVDVKHHRRFQMTLLSTSSCDTRQHRWLSWYFARRVRFEERFFAFEAFPRAEISLLAEREIKKVANAINFNGWNNIIPTAAKYQSFFSVLSALVGRMAEGGNRNFHAKPSPKKGVRMNVFEEKRAVRRKHNKKRLIWFVFRVENQVRGRLRVTLMGLRSASSSLVEFRKFPWKSTSHCSETFRNNEKLLRF